MRPTQNSTHLGCTQKSLHTCVSHLIPVNHRHYIEKITYQYKTPYPWVVLNPVYFHKVSFAAFHLTAQLTYWLMETFPLNKHVGLQTQRHGRGASLVGTHELVMNRAFKKKKKSTRKYNRGEIKHNEKLWLIINSFLYFTAYRKIMFINLPKENQAEREGELGASRWSPRVPSQHMVGGVRLFSQHGELQGSVSIILQPSPIKP